MRDGLRDIFLALEGEVYRDDAELAKLVREAYITRHPTEFSSKSEAAQFVQAADANHWIIRDANRLTVRVV